MLQAPWRAVSNTMQVQQKNVQTGDIFSHAVSLFTPVKQQKFVNCSTVDTAASMELHFIIR